MAIQSRAVSGIRLANRGFSRGWARYGTGLSGAGGGDPFMALLP
jgi:hypothetical protein